MAPEAIALSELGYPPTREDINWEDKNEWIYP